MIRKIVEGVRINSSKYSPLSKPLREWINLMKHYQEIEKEPPYYFLERSNVGFLSAAIFKAGGVALEEFNADKRNRGTNQTKRGRVDLFFDIDNVDAIVEFKQVWISITNGFTNNCISTIKKAYRLAKEDVFKSKSLSSNGLIGLFLIPYDRYRDINKQKTVIRELLNKTIDTFTPDVAAWYFPEESADTEYPGIICVLRQPRKTD